MNTNIFNFLAHDVEWIFSGIGVLAISLIINGTRSNGAENKNNRVTKFCNILTGHAKWVFSGIGVLAISLIINSTCSNGAEDKSHTTTNISGVNTRDISGNISGTVIGKNEGAINSGDKVSRDKAGTINHGDEVSGDKVLVSGDQVNAETIYYGDKVGGDKHIHNPPPSFKKVTVAFNKEGNPIGIADNPSPIQNSIQLLGKLMRGEEVKLEEASPSKFLINSGTEISILESDDSSEQPSIGFIDPIGFAKFEKIKILEGPHKGKTGWIHASMISHEERKK